jgi:orotate phosphoribosyltransferase
MYDRAALEQLVREKALKFGDFTLASGKKAKFYLDCRQITLDSQGARLIGEGMLDLIAGDMPDLVGGMAKNPNSTAPAKRSKGRFAKANRS